MLLSVDGSSDSGLLGQQPAQRKVTVYVIRNVAGDPELVTFWHPGGGRQIPAGTVEPGESYDAAALREAGEETGLTDIELIDDLGVEELIMSDGRALVLAETNLRLSPAGAETHWRLSRTGGWNCSRNTMAGGWSAIKNGIWSSPSCWLLN
ncbi:MAG TPA: NUDIX domain-containing protein [Microlunatus sp.]